MNELSPAITYSSMLFAIIGLALAATGTIKSTRAKDGREGLAFMVLAGLGYVLLGLSAAMQARENLGLRAAVAQMIAVVAAAALGFLCQGPAARDTESGSRGLGVVGLFLAWLCLLGLPPTVGFHGKALLYRSLLQAGWSWLYWLALLVNAAGMLPGFRALATSRPRPLRGAAWLLAVLLIAVILVLGLYPGIVVGTGLSAPPLPQ